MKITICGSLAFKKEMLEFRDKLKKLGHKPIIASYIEDLVLGRKPKLLKQIKKNHGKVKKDYGFIKWYYQAIKRSDAILVLNFDKKGIKNYIGGNTLMEMGFAHIHDKKIFLLNPIPELGYKDEIRAIVTKVLSGDLRLIGKEMKKYAVK